MQADHFLVAPQALGAARAAARVVDEEGPSTAASSAGSSKGPTVRAFPRVLRRGSKPAFAATLVLGIFGLCIAPSAAAFTASTPEVQRAVSLVSGGERALESAQSFEVPDTVQNHFSQREADFSTFSLADRATELSIAYTSALYTNDTTAAIQWPFAVGVPMSSGYGPRNGRLHEGIDLVPGDGATIQAIADGIVRVANEAGGAYGVHVYIDHVIDGETVTSHYAHMQYGSLQVAAGDAVSVGDPIGLVGNTGRSYGSHLHFEILFNGSTANPLPWLQANVGRDSL